VTKNNNNSSGLMKDRYPNRDLFIADILDATPKDDMGSMEHPMFALRAGDKTIRYYEHNGNSIQITPSVLGLATIYDKDILIYCTSQLVEKLNRGVEISRKVRVTAYDIMVTCNRPDGGAGYKKLKEALKRLRGTSIETNIKTNGIRITEGFGLIDKYKIVEKSPTDGRMVAIDITLSEWLFNGIKAFQVKTISRDYFRLRKPLERRLYELVHKHINKNSKWEIGLAKLHKKTGSRSTLKLFRQKIKKATESNPLSANQLILPDYRFVFDEKSDKVTFYSRAPKGALKQVKDICSL